jgi:predicted acyltransferase
MTGTRPLADPGSSRLQESPRPMSSSASPPPERSAPSTTSGRIHSLDAMRGYTMFLTISIGFLGEALASLSGHPLVRGFLLQFEHSPWNGLTYADLAFPLYVLVMGSALRLGLSRARERGSPRGVLMRGVLQRAAILFFLGFLCNGGFTEPWPEVRIAGVLQRLALCYLATSAVFLWLGDRMRAVTFAAILLGYWAMMAWIPVPGYGAGDLSPVGNLAAWVDERFLPGKAAYGTWDPEGILTTLPAIGTCLGGVLLGKIFELGWSGRRRVLALVLVGIVAVAIGKLWAPAFPINKHLWSSTFVLAAGGLACLHIAAFELICEVWGKWRLVLPFLHYGRNSLVAYAGDRLLPMGQFAETLVGGSVALALGPVAPLVLALVVIGIEWGILAQLYRRRIFVRL